MDRPVTPERRALDLRVLGETVRAERQRMGLSLRALADAAGLSERFVSDLERGHGNISIARLAQVADALGVGLAALVAPLDALRRPARRRIVALVGLRGAGKSTIGAALAERLSARFVELDQAIEARAALPLAQVFEIHGESYYRRLELGVLVELLERARGATVIATGGGLVGHDEAWRLLRREARTVWLRASPEDHYARVIAQGDLRPMKNRPSAMAELRALLAAREPRYGEAELVVDTSALGVAGSVAAIAAALAA
jgi:XRE family aerobic/anaerobic benzoate catabolism transcriptional regulator